jgi:mRNA-degrading endonuclease toxin of MazEF toxin-antitoxin module
VSIEAAESGLPLPSAVLCDQIRTIAKLRLVRRLGAVGGPKLATIEDTVRMLLGL